MGQPAPIPQTIGRYEVRSLLGHGGMGNVYLAVDPKLKRPLAIKVVRPQAGEDMDLVLERFHREAEISAQLSHPNIITVYDVGEDPTVGAFLAMEYIKGRSLAAVIKQHRPGLDTGLFLLLQAMRAILAAHSAGIIHRDIKPENMMVSDDGRLKLMDFGLARGGHSRLTATGMVMGTPSFTAPELMLGGEPSDATDRYAFFVTAFELLSGDLPFRGDSLGVTLYRIVHDPPEIPTSMPASLAACFQRALVKDPAARPVDLVAFMRDLVQGSGLPESGSRRFLSLLDLEGPAMLPMAVNPEPAPPPQEATVAVASPSHPLPTEAITPTPSRPSLSGVPKVPSPPKPAVPRPGTPPRPVVPKLAPTLPAVPKPAAPKPVVPKPPVPRPPTLAVPPSAGAKAGVPPPPRPGVPPAPRPGVPRVTPPPQPVLPPAPADGVIPLAALAPEPLSWVEDGGEDPFANVDWETVLAQDAPAPAVGLDDLEAWLADADVVKAESEAEAREELADLDAALSLVDGADLLQAEERAESQEAYQSLACDLETLQIPDDPDAL